MLTKSDIDWLKDEFLRSLADEIESRMSKKLDSVSTKLDTFVGEIQKRRDEQDLHSGQHAAINDRFERVDKHLGITTSV